MDWKNISGEKYDWTKTRKPERPYIHDYTKTLVYKLFLAIPNEAHTESIVYETFESALEVIKKVDLMSLGMPKIVYLVGWQYLGHDSKYPAWDSVNESLKRECDKTAKDSLLWLMEEGFKYNTTVSLHINIQDAYKDSPLWDEYVKEDLITLNADKSLCEGDVWNNQLCYIVSYKQIWDKGVIQKRIEELCDFLPIQKAGTIHIDAMHARADVGHGWSLEDIQAARNKIVRFWRDKGIDVTSEFCYYETPDWQARKDQLTGLMPLAYHFSQNLDEYIKKPASLMCGANISRRFREGISDEMDKLFGASFNIEGIIMKGDWEDAFFDSFCKCEPRYRYLMSLDRKSANITPDDITAEFSDGVETHIDGRMYKNGELIGDDSFVVVPSKYQAENVYFARADKDVSVDMKKAFGEDGEYSAFRFDKNGVSRNGVKNKLEDGKLLLKKGEVLIIKF